VTLGHIRSIRFAILCAAVAATLMASQSPAGAAGSGDTAITGTGQAAHRYLVSLRGLAMPSPGSSGITSAAATQREVARVARVDRTVAGLAARLGFRTRFQYRWAFQGFAADLDAKQRAALRADPRVAAVSIDMPVQLTEQSVPAGVHRVRAQPASLDGPAVPDLSTVNVAVIDTGIRHLTTNPTETELNIGGGIDCAEDDKRLDTDPSAWKDVDPGGHGSHVAGIIGAIDNTEGVVGVAPGVRLWSVRVFDSDLQGSEATVACGLDWVAQTRSMSNAPAGTQPIDVANLSLRGPRTGNGPDACLPSDPDVEHVAVCGAYNAGVTLVVAAGNESMDAVDVIPAAYDQVITVAALSDFDGVPGGDGAETCPGPRGRETDDTFARYSNFGSDIDLIAPGTCIVSLNKSGTLSGTRVLSGTSMAAPHVTGAAARYIADVVNTTAERPKPGMVRSALRATASFNWNTSSDPDGTPDRLLNVAGLSATPRFALSAFPSRVTVPAGSEPAVRVVQVELVRPGLFANTVHITASALTGVKPTPAAQNLTGINDAGIASTVRITVSSSVPDGDYPVPITASSSGFASRNVTVTVHVDRHLPTVADLAATMIPGTSLGGRVAVHLSWHGRDTGGTISRYELQRQIGSEPWQPVGLASPASPSADRLMELKTDYGFRVRATDDSGNIGEWTAIRQRVGIRESDRPSITYSGSGWTTLLRSSASGGSLQSSHSVGAFANVTFYGTGVAWVAPVGPGKGTATVIVDGDNPGVTVDLRAPTLGTKRVVFGTDAMAPGRHTLTIKVKNGTVDLDAILILG
jgi:subtilisin family serine protease